MLNIMPGTYKITAVPTLFCEGKFAGQLKSVTFTAVSPTDTRQWPAKNCGQFETAFSRIMPKSEAHALVAALMNGDTLDLPGVYQENQFDQGFLLEWSPVHLVLPPIFFPETSHA
jgi:hypothetical protein